MRNEITNDLLDAFARHLGEGAFGTIANYLRHVRAFAAWLCGRAATHGEAVNWREHLLAEGYKPTTVNGMLTSLNCFFAFAGWNQCRVRALRIQRRLFRDDSRELTRDEYLRIYNTSATGEERSGLIGDKPLQWCLRTTK